MIRLIVSVVLFALAVLGLTAIASNIEAASHPSS
jgi:hypothetical protein